MTCIGITSKFIERQNVLKVYCRDDLEIDTYSKQLNSKKQFFSRGPKYSSPLKRSKSASSLHRNDLADFDIANKFQTISESYYNCSDDDSRKTKIPTFTLEKIIDDDFLPKIILYSIWPSPFPSFDRGAMLHNTSFGYFRIKPISTSKDIPLHIRYTKKSIERISRGAYGFVYPATDKNDYSKDLVIKESLSNREAFEETKHESEILSFFNENNVPNILELIAHFPSEDGQKYNLVFQRYEKSLFDIIFKNHSSLNSFNRASCKIQG